MHPWHHISKGPNPPEIISAVIEIPKGSMIKYELDKQSGALIVDRVLYSSLHYPANYGFVPQTYCDDDDPLDILVLGQGVVVPMCAMRARPIGIIKMIDQGQEDDKIIAIHVDDPEFSHYTDISQLPSHCLKVLKRFFEDYKALEQKEVKIDEFLGADEAKQAIQKAFDLYDSKKLDLIGYYEHCPCNK